MHIEKRYEAVKNCMYFDGTIEIAKQDGTHNAETKILTSVCSAVTCCGLIAPWLFQTARHLCTKVLLIKSITILCKYNFPPI